MRGEPVDVRPVSPIEQREGLAVARGDSRDQLVVQSLLMLSHARHVCVFLEAHKLGALGSGLLALAPLAEARSQEPKA